VIASPAMASGLLPGQKKRLSVDWPLSGGGLELQNPRRLRPTGQPFALPAAKIHLEIKKAPAGAFLTVLWTG